MVQVGLHQDSVVSPLLLFIVLGAISKESKPGCPEELFYDDLSAKSQSRELFLKTCWHFARLLLFGWHLRC